jgi:erythromycin esterase
VRALVLLLALALLGCPAGPGEAAREEPEALAVIQWASENAVKLKTADSGAPLDDLEPLRDIVGDARVVFLGESRHDAAEHFRLKHRMIRYLVEEMGFTRFAIEDSLPGAGPLNDYVLGGDGDPEVLLNRIGAWYIWDTEEVLALVKWMRAHNLDRGEGKKVSYHGVDVVDVLPARENVLAYLDRVDPEHAAALREGPVGRAPFSPSLWSETLERYGELTEDAIDALGVAFTGLLTTMEEKREAYVARSSTGEYEWMLRQAWTLERANDLFTTWLRGSFVDAGTVREKAMADNIRRLLEEIAPGERLIVWCHNVHASKGPVDMDIPDRPPARDVPQLARYVAEMGYPTVSIGFTFNQGQGPDYSFPAADEGTVDGVLARVGLPLFLLDLRTAPAGGPAHAWLHRKQSMQGQGGMVGLVPAEAYDALIFTETITRAVPSARASERFEELGGP